jgi:hypothetical protein
MPLRSVCARKDAIATWYPLSLERATLRPRSRCERSEAIPLSDRMLNFVRNDGRKTISQPEGILLWCLASWTACKAGLTADYRSGNRNGVDPVVTIRRTKR